MVMDLIVGSRSASLMAWRQSRGTEVLSAETPNETTLDQLLEWLRETTHRWTLDTSGDAVIISHWNDAEVEVIRTTITCDATDREELIKVLEAERS